MMVFVTPSNIRTIDEAKGKKCKLCNKGELLVFRNLSQVPSYLVDSIVAKIVAKIPPDEAVIFCPECQGYDRVKEPRT